MMEKETHDLLISECTGMGMTKIEFFRRLMNWYTNQNDTLKSEILGVLPSSLRTSHTAAAVLAEMIKSDPKAKTAPKDIAKLVTDILKEDAK